MSDHDSLAAALADVQSRLPRIAKGETATVETKQGGSFTYSYAGLTTISEALLPLLAEAGLAWTCRPTLTDAGRFVLAYSLLHVSGEREDGEYPLPDGGTPQAVGSAITYGRRYCLCAVTGVAPDEDDDGAAAERHFARREGPPDTSRLEDLLSQAAELGLDVDRDKSLEYAGRSQANCDLATDRLAGRLAEHRKAKLEDDSSGGGQDGGEGEAPPDPPPPEGTTAQQGGAAEPSDTGKGQPAAESSAGTGAGEGGHDDRRESTSSPDTSSDEPYEWKAHCAEAGVRKFDVVKALIKTWPSNDQAARPNKVADVDALLERRPEMAKVVRGAIDDLAEGDG